MIISRDKEAIYIAIPHSGSSFFQDHVCKSIHGRYLPESDDGNIFVDSSFYKHASLQEIKAFADKKLGIDISKYHAFAVVRHPAEFLFSEWNLNKRVIEQYRGCSEETLRQYINNEGMIGWILRVQEWFDPDQPFLEYLKFISKVREGSIFQKYLNSDIPTTTLRFEDFENSYTAIAAAIGVPVPNFDNKVNANPNKDSSQICKASRELIYETYSFDFQTFNYNKDGSDA